MRIVGVDFGIRRIGLAVSDPTRTLARPVETILAGHSVAETVRRVLVSIRALELQDEPIGAIVVGLPRHLDGEASEQTGQARAFGDLLRSEGDREVVFVDERLTSREAEQRLALRERDWRKRKKRLDAAAAAVILQEYLDSVATPGHATQEPE
jgi:putative Holliday junction resolvase